MVLTRAELIRSGMGMAAGSLFLGWHSPKALARAAGRPGTAVLCGMDRYPKLRGGINRIGRDDLEEAGTNSARLVREALSKHGFATKDVVLLANPTKGQIIDAIRANAQPGRPFLFYFLGHGSRDAAANGTLLAADAEDDKPDTYLRRDDLRRELTELIRKGVLVTACLDACESWSMAFELGEKSLPRIRAFPLYYEQFKAIQQRDRRSRPDTVEDVLLQPCFFTAADETQKAWVAPMPDLQNKNIGLFSYYLAQALRSTGQEDLWENVYKKVAGSCRDYSSEHRLAPQTPKISAVYLGTPLFQEKQKGVLDVDRLFDLEFPNSQTLSVRVKPLKGPVNPASIKVSEEFDIEIPVRGQGYLVAVEKTPDRRYRLHFPADGSVDAAHVADQTILLPLNSNKVFYHDRAGRDTFKAFLYQDRASAEKLLSLLAPAKGDGADSGRAKDMRTKARPGQPGDIVARKMVTATYRFDVEPEEAKP